MDNTMTTSDTTPTATPAPKQWKGIDLLPLGTQVKLLCGIVWTIRSHGATSYLLRTPINPARRKPKGQCATRDRGQQLYARCNIHYRETAALRKAMLPET